MSDDRPTLQRYVAPALIPAIGRKIASPDGLDADDFLQAQDYVDAWESNIAVREPRIAHGSATVVVLLGAPDGERDRLSISSIETPGASMIRRVRARR